MAGQEAIKGELENPPSETVTIAVNPIPLKGCLKGCLVLVGLALAIYAILAGLALTGIMNKQRQWESNGFTSYSATVKYGTESGIYATQLEIVTDGKRTEANAYDTEPTIDRLFNAAKMCALIPIPFMSC